MLPMPIDATTFVNEFFDKCNQLHRTLPLNKNSPWTDGVKKWLEDEGHKRNFKTYRTRTIERDQIFSSEFLLDLVWYREQPPQAGALACEIEWETPGAVRQDFEKLLCFKAPVKLMIFSSWNPTKRREAVSLLTESLLDYGDHYPGEHYLLLDLGWDDKVRVGWEYRIYEGGATRGLSQIHGECTS